MASPGKADREAHLTVVGIGSRYRSDDGIGLALVDAFAAQMPPPGVVAETWADIDTMGTVHGLLAVRSAVLFVDCATMDLQPGDWRLFRDSEARLRAHAPSVTTHGLGLGEGLALARSLGFTQPVWFFGVEPATVAFGGELSPTLRTRLPALTAALMGAVRSVVDVGGSDGGG